MVVIHAPKPPRLNGRAKSADVQANFSPWVLIGQSQILSNDLKANKLFLDR